MSLTVADAGLWFWLFAGLHVLGLASVLFCRVPKCHSWHRLAEQFFVGCLVVVGLITVGSICCQSSCWVWCGTIFSLMAVGGTSDLGRAAEISGF